MAHTPRGRVHITGANFVSSGRRPAYRKIHVAWDTSAGKPIYYQVFKRYAGGAEFWDYPMVKISAAALRRGWLDTRRAYSVLNDAHGTLETVVIVLIAEVGVNVDSWDLNVVP